MSWQRSAKEKEQQFKPDMEVKRTEQRKVRKDMAITCAREVTKQAMQATKQAVVKRKLAELRAEAEAHKNQASAKVKCIPED